MKSDPPRRRALPGLRIGLAEWHDPEDRAAFSGVPASIVSALRALGVEVVPISETPSPAVAALAWRVGALAGIRPSDLRDREQARQRLWRVGQWSRPTRVADMLALRRRARAAAPLDGLVQLGAELAAPAGVRMVTFQDSTLAQAIRAYPWPHLQGLSHRQLERNVRREGAVLRHAVTCGAATHWVADSIERDHGIPRERIRVLGRGANLAPRAGERTWDTPRFLFVGADWRRKNGDLLLRAFGRVREAVPDATLDLVGGHPRVERPGVEAHGRLDLADEHDRRRIEDLYERATVFVLPSLHEPLGLSHIEAGVAGIPSIGSTNGGSVTFIADAGRLIDPTNEDALVAAMLELCDGRLARRLGERARERASLFAWEKVAERLLRALEIPGLDVSGMADFL